MATSSCFLLCATLFLMISLSHSLSFKTTTDQTTLVAFKNHILTTNPHHFLAGNWSAAASVCSWTGVTCGSRHRRVTNLSISGMGVTATIPTTLLGNLSFLMSLDLSGNKLHGKLPEDLAGMPRLRVVNLKNNSFSGFIPASFSNISELERLIISHNNLEGNIPHELGNLSNLKVFDGDSNMLSGALPTAIGNLKMLQVLSLAHNKFEGLIPQEIGNLENLMYLVLSSNMLSGALPNAIGNLRMLQILSLADNNFKGLIPQEIGNLEKLQYLGLSSNMFNGSIPSSIFNIPTLTTISMSQNELSGTLEGLSLPNIEVISLYGNSLTGKIPESISNSSKLKEISLQRNMFTGQIPTFFGNLRLLECLHLYDNMLTNDPSHQELTFITSLTNCPHLRDFSVSGNPLDGLLPPSIGNLSKTVIRIFASGCKIKGRIPDEMGNLSSLPRLDLTDNDLSGSIPTTFWGLRSLQGLFLDKNKLHGSFPSSLCDLHGLSLLGLSQNQISGPIPDCIGNVTSLREINLACNSLSSRIPSAMFNLKDILELNLSSNSFSGNLPLELENLKVATLIDLSRNNFTGVVPADAYGSMQSLSKFSLASNKLQGSIPQSFGKLIALEWLDLSNNDLSGEIPKSLQGLRGLEYFNVSFNRLRGEIPSEGPFKNLTNYQFFMSNEALCGAPQLHVPLCHSTSSSRMRSRLIILIVSVVIGSLILAMIIVYSLIKRQRRKEDPSLVTDSFEGKVAERFSYMQIQDATNGFNQENLLGSGSFGSVYVAHFEKGVVLAVKVFNLGVEYASKSFKTECEMLSTLRHRNLTKVISACSNLDFKALLLEYMQNGSLHDWLHSDGYVLDLLQRLDIMIDVASALEYLHHGFTKPVIHCDLKPSNILLDSDMVGHVTDFGITKLLGHEESIVHTQTLATLGYMAPEYGSEGIVSTACDVYSYGILLMETFTRRQPSNDMFGGDLSLRKWIHASLPNSIDQVVDSTLLREGEEHFTPKMQCFSSIFALAMDCTIESPKERMNMKDVSATLKKIKLHFNTMLGSIE